MDYKFEQLYCPFTAMYSVSPKVQVAGEGDKTSRSLKKRPDDIFSLELRERGGGV